jgi:hypothetical protein
MTLFAITWPVAVVWSVGIAAGALVLSVAIREVFKTGRRGITEHHSQ